jgi:uncharacterized protein with beta-barrel porin domain
MFKAAKLLLASSAIIALGAVSSPAGAIEGGYGAGSGQALAVTSGNQIYASSGTFDESAAPSVATAAAGDDINITNGATLTITNNGTANDGSTDTNTFAPGDITGSGSVVVTTGSANPLTVTIDSIVTDSGDFTVSNTGNNGASVNASLTANTILNGNMAITNTATTLQTVALATNDALTVNGTTTITGGGFAGAGSALDAFLNTTFNGAVTLIDNTGGAVLGYTGTVAQTSSGSGAINGGSANTGTLIIDNAAGVTIGNEIGNLNALKTISIDGGTLGSSATFTNNTAAQSIVLGDTSGAATVNTLTFDSTNGSIAVAGAISGALAGETNNVVLTGGNTVTVANTIGTDGTIDTINVGNNTTASIGGAIEATSGLTVGTGGTLNAAGNVTAPVTLGSGATLTLANVNQTLDGDVNGPGTLNIAGTGETITGSIGNTTSLDALTIDGGLTVTTAAGTVNPAGNRTIAASAITLSGASTLTLAPGTGTITVANTISDNTNGDGTVTISDAGGTPGIVDFGGDIGSASAHLAALTVTNGPNTNTINAYGSVYANATTLNTADTLNLLGSDSTISGTINGGATGRGVVNVGDGTNSAIYTFNGAVGATARPASFNVNGNAAAITTANIAAGALNLEGTAIVEGGSDVALTSTTATHIDGAFGTALTGGATVTLNSDGNVVDIGTNEGTIIGAGNQIRIGSTALTIGANGLNNTLLVESTPSFNPVATPVIDATVDGTTVTIAPGSTLNVALAGSAVPANGSAITVIAGNTNAATSYATLLANGTITLDNTALLDIANNGSDAQNLKIAVSYNNPNTVIGAPYASAATALINDSAASGTLAQARANLFYAPTAAQARAVASSISPTVDGSNVTAAENVSTQVFGVTQMRLASLEGAPGSGASSGDLPADSHSWGQFFGQDAQQGYRDGVDGFVSRTYGAAVGYDAGVADDRAHVGMALSYARTNASSRNANGTDTGIDSYQGTLYGDMDILDNMYLKGMAGYAFNDNHTDRHDVGGIDGLDATGSFNANQLAARAEVGRPVALGTRIGNVVVTPSVMADYTYYNAASYTESGAGTANLAVNQDSLDKLDLGAQVAADFLVQDPWWGGTFKPGVSAGYKYDVIGDNVDTTASFTGGGAAFGTQGLTPARGELDLGANVKYFTRANWNLSAEYDYEMKTDYHANDGILRATYLFN